jgi:hypothetical protein
METTNNVIHFPSTNNEDEPMLIIEDLDKEFDSFLVNMANLGYEDILITKHTSIRLAYILELIRVTFLVGRGYEHEWENHMNLTLSILQDAGAIIEEDEDNID